MAGLLDTALKAEIRQIFTQEGIPWPGSNASSSEMSTATFAVERVVGASPPPPLLLRGGGGDPPPVVKCSTSRVFAVILLCVLAAYALWRCNPDIIST